MARRAALPAMVCEALTGERSFRRHVGLLRSESVYGGAEWQAAWIRDPLGADRKLLVVRVEECERPGLLAAIVGPDLFRLSEPEARDGLLKMAAAAVTGQRLKPPAAPGFPGANRTVSEVPRFPGDDAGREPHAPTAPGLGRRLFSARIGRHSGQLSVAFGADDTLVVVEQDTTVHRWSLGGTSRARSTSSSGTSGPDRTRGGRPLSPPPPILG